MPEHGAGDPERSAEEGDDGQAAGGVAQQILGDGARAPGRVERARCADGVADEAFHGRKTIFSRKIRSPCRRWIMSAETS